MITKCVSSCNTTQTLEEEKAELNRTVRALREEVRLLSEQLNEVLQKCDDVKAGQKSEGACIREIVNLKKKVCLKHFYPVVHLNKADTINRLYDLLPDIITVSCLTNTTEQSRHK